MIRVFQCLLLCALSPLGFGDSVQDAFNTTVTCRKPAKRIISLAPDITEILFAIGAGNDLIATISGSDFPEQAKKLPVVGSFRGLDMEKIILLKPDLIVTWSFNFFRQLYLIRQLGIPIYHTRPSTWQDIPATMINLGKLTGHTQEAQLVAQHFEHDVHMLTQQYSNLKPVDVYFQIGNQNLLTVNRSSWINQVIELCGGLNVFRETKGSLPRISFEALFTANPQNILISSKTVQDAIVVEYWSSLWAVRNKQLYYIQPDWIERPGPRLLLGMKQVCSLINQTRQKL